MPDKVGYFGPLFEQKPHMAELSNLIGTKWRCKANNGVYTVIDQTEHPAGLPGLLQNDILTLQAESATRPHPVSVQTFITIRVGALPELFSKYRDPQPIGNEAA